MKQEEYNEELNESITEYAEGIKEDFPEYVDLLLFHISNQLKMEVALFDMYESGKKLGHKIGFAIGTGVCAVMVILLNFL